MFSTSARASAPAPVAWAHRFPEVRIAAVDSSPTMLATLRATAARGTDGRVDTLQADVAAARLDVEPVDLVWSANALHEVADPARAFDNLFHATRPGGALAVLEFAGHPWVLPERFSALESVLRSAAGADDAVPDWARAITDAGFTLTDRRLLGGDQQLPADGPGGEYAALQLRLLAHHGGSALRSEDSERLRAIAVDLTGAHEVVDTVHIRGTRTLWLARRP